MESRPWQVLHVLANHEKRVAQHLVVRSVEHYLPFYTERVKWTWSARRFLYQFQ
jgi:hypothetical protein